MTVQWIQNGPRPQTAQDSVSKLSHSGNRHLPNNGSPGPERSRLGCSSPTYWCLPCLNPTTDDWVLTLSTDTQKSIWIPTEVQESLKIFFIWQIPRTWKVGKKKKKDFEKGTWEENIRSCRSVFLCILRFGPTFTFTLHDVFFNQINLSIFFSSG